MGRLASGLRSRGWSCTAGTKPQSTNVRGSSGPSPRKPRVTDTPTVGRSRARTTRCIDGDDTRHDRVFPTTAARRQIENLANNLANRTVTTATQNDNSGPGGPLLQRFSLVAGVG